MIKYLLLIFMIIGIDLNCAALSTEENLPLTPEFWKTTDSLSLNPETVGVMTLSYHDNTIALSRNSTMLYIAIGGFYGGVDDTWNAIHELTGDTLGIKTIKVNQALTDMLHEGFAFDSLEMPKNHQLIVKSPYELPTIPIFLDSIPWIPRAIGYNAKRFRKTTN